MRFNRKTGFGLAFFFGFFTLLIQVSPGQVIPLNDSWKFRKAGDSVWNLATVPGTVHTDLLQDKFISDPFYRTNESSLQWIDREDWEYKKVFIIRKELLECDKMYLVFEGLDTYADIFLNGKKILIADNMFRTWKTDIRAKLKIGENLLTVLFHSPTKMGEALMNSLPFKIPASDNDHGSPKVSVFTRKAGYHYGWDWGPRFVTSGIWRPVYLEGVRKTFIQDLFIRQKELTKKKAELQALLEVESLNAGKKHLEIWVEGSPNPVYAKEVYLDTGITHLVCSFSLMHPKLWWPNGYGSHTLYHFKAILSTNKKEIAIKRVSHGMRTLELIQESETQGNSFYFLVNGVKMFMKGANYVPQDNFLPRVTLDRYQHLIYTAVACHMNMLRVWGGGIYENDLFYDLCDENGILVYQDFMFACAMVPPLENTRQNIYEEAVQNIKRLRNHSCIALYCGNNEVAAFMGSDFWGTAKDAFRDNQDYATIINSYKDVFHQLLPAVVKAYDNDRFYWSSSPQARNYSLYNHDSRTSGDVHYYWDVAKAENPMEVYEDNVGPFMTEYGFQSFPDLQTVHSFSLPADEDINSEVMKFHQKSVNGNGAILAYIKKWYTPPTTFPDFLYTGQVLQAQGIKLAIEAHRRAKPFCMGSLYWQIDDCWPVASWSSMDYYGHWKALQYEAKRGFAKVLVSTVLKKDTAHIYVISDSLQPINSVLNLRLMTLDGHIINQKNIPALITANSSRDFYQSSIKDLLKGANPKNRVLMVRLLQKNKELGQSCLYFEPIKFLNLRKSRVNFLLTHKGDRYTLTLSSLNLLKDLRISVGDENIVLSDNYFDLVPGNSKTIAFKSQKPISKGDIAFRSLNDI